MIILDITEDLITKAKQYEKETLENLPENGVDYTGVNIPRKYFVGYLSELLFERLLQNSDKKYIYEPIRDGKSHGSDFTVYAHRALQIDIKASENPNAIRLLVNQKQYDLYHYDLYVGIHLKEQKAIIHGYCMPDQFNFISEGFTNDKIPTYYQYYSKLSPIEDLLKKLKSSRDLTP